MLEIIRSDSGEILGACEWYLVSSHGDYDPRGSHVWINECEISKTAEHKGLLREFTRIIIGKIPDTVTHAYFWRKEKYKNRSPRIYSRERWQKLIKEVADVHVDLER